MFQQLCEQVATCRQRPDRGSRARLRFRSGHVDGHRWASGCGRCCGDAVDLLEEAARRATHVDRGGDQGGQAQNGPRDDFAAAATHWIERLHGSWNCACWPAAAAGGRLGCYRRSAHIKRRRGIEALRGGNYGAALECSLVRTDVTAPTDAGTKPHHGAGTRARGRNAGAMSAIEERWPPPRTVRRSAHDSAPHRLTPPAQEENTRVTQPFPREGNTSGRGRNSAPTLRAKRSGPRQHRQLVRTRGGRKHSVCDAGSSDADPPIATRIRVRTRTPRRLPRSGARGRRGVVAGCSLRDPDWMTCCPRNEVQDEVSRHERQDLLHTQPVRDFGSPPMAAIVSSKWGLSVGARPRALAGDHRRPGAPKGRAGAGHRHWCRMSDVRIVDDWHHIGHARTGSVTTVVAGEPCS